MEKMLQEHQVPSASENLALCQEELLPAPVGQGDAGDLVGDLGHGEERGVVLGQGGVWGVRFECELGGGNAPRNKGAEVRGVEGELRPSCPG